MQTTRWAVPLLVVTLLTGPVLGADGVLLQYKFEGDEKLEYTLELSTQARFTMQDGTTESQSMKSYLEMEQELIAKQGDASRVAVTVKKATQTVNGKQNTLINEAQTQIVTMLPSGQVTSQQGAQPAAGQQIQMVFPAKPVKVGESWEQRQTLPPPIPLAVTTTYTLEKQDATYPGYGKTAIITSHMKVAEGGGPGGEEVSSRTNGRLWFDVAKGRIVRSTANSRFDFSLPITPPGLPATNVKVSLDVTMELKLASLSR